MTSQILEVSCGLHADLLGAAQTRQRPSLPDFKIVGKHGEGGKARLPSAPEDLRC